MNAHLQPVLARALAPMAPPQSVVHQIVAADAAAVTPAERRAVAAITTEPRFPFVSCSQCGNEFGPGDAGFSDCREHRSAAELQAIRDHHDDEYRTGLDKVGPQWDDEEGEEVAA